MRRRSEVIFTTHSEYKCVCGVTHGISGGRMASKQGESLGVRSERDEDKLSWNYTVVSLLPTYLITGATRWLFLLRDATFRRAHAPTLLLLNRE